MNILFHCPTKFDLNSISNSKLGGIETLNLELCNNLSSKDYNIYLSTICKKVIKRKNLTNLPITKLKKENHNYNFKFNNLSELSWEQQEKKLNIIYKKIIN